MQVTYGPAHRLITGRAYYIDGEIRVRKYQDGTWVSHWYLTPEDALRAFDAECVQFIEERS